MKEKASIIYNITVKVDNSIADRWLRWMQQEYTPQVMRTNCFQEHKIARLLEVDDSDGPTYAIQYMAATKADYDRYMELHAEPMRQMSHKQWGQSFVAFHSVMQVIA
jgi:hypothetical protein